MVWLGNDRKGGHEAPCLRAEAKAGYYLDYLNLGFHVGPSVGHDNHWRNWGTSTDARVGVIADALTRADILLALKARHTFASDDKNIEVIFRSGESLGGDIVEALIEAGVISMDYTLSRISPTRARDHGYLFKIHPANLGALFPPSKLYALE